MVEMNNSKQNVEEKNSIASIEQILPTPVASPQNKHTECTHYDDDIETTSTIVPPTVRATKRRAASRTIDFSEVQQPKRSRGRPPKTEPTVISPTEYKKLSLADRKYYEMRVKNNEASRRSRLSKKGKEEALFDELHHLEQKYQQLQQKDHQIDYDLEKWKKRLLKLAQL